MIFERSRVIKTASSSQYTTLIKFPDVFVKVLSAEPANDDLVRFTMPRLRSPDVTEMNAAMIAGFQVLRHKLWCQLDLFPQPLWREKLWTHLRQSWPNTNPVTRLVNALPEPAQPCAIHGDPTFANLLWDRHRKSWVWCDPLDRAFIPHDPHVDLGKGFQSCWGYERLLLGEIDAPYFDGYLAQELTDAAGLVFDHARNWAYVHMIRLLRYQDPLVMGHFTKVLEDAGF